MEYTNEAQFDYTNEAQFDYTNEAQFDYTNEAQFVMTVIIAANMDNKVVMIGDRLSSNNHTQHLLDTNKVITKIINNKPLLIGCAGSFRVSNLLQYQLDYDKNYHFESINEFIYTEFIDDVAKLLRDKKVSYDSKGSFIDSEIIVAYGNNIWKIQSDFSILRYHTEFVCIGSGAEFAYGYLSNRILDINVLKDCIFYCGRYITTVSTLQGGEKWT